MRRDKRNPREVGLGAPDGSRLSLCNAAAGEREPPIGPSVDDLVAAVTSSPEFHASAPVDVTVGAFEGMEIELAAIDSGDECPEVIAFSVGEGTFGCPTGAGRVAATLQILGRGRHANRCVYARDPTALYLPWRPKLQKMLDSIRIEPFP